MFSYPTMHVSEGFNDHMHVNFLKQFLKKNKILKILELPKLMGMLFMVVCLDVDYP